MVFTNLRALSPLLSQSSLFSQTLSRSLRCFRTQLPHDEESLKFGRLARQLLAQGKVLSHSEWLQHLEDSNIQIKGGVKYISTTSFLSAPHISYWVYEVTPQVVVKEQFKPLTFSRPRSHFEHVIATKRIPAIQKMIHSGIDINGHGPNGLTPLFTAVETGSLKIVELLMQNGANPRLHENTSWNYNTTPYHRALSMGFHNMTKLFIEKWNVPHDQHVVFNDYGWPPEAIEFALPYEENPHKIREKGKILTLLLQNIGTSFIRQEQAILKRVQEHKTCKGVEIKEMFEAEALLLARGKNRRF